MKASLVKRLRKELALQNARNEPPPALPLDCLFPVQRAFAESAATFKAALCSRRAGKSSAIARMLIARALQDSGVLCLYLSLSGRHARFNFWPAFKSIVRASGIPCEVREVDLSVDFSNGSSVTLSGVKDKTEIEKFRGSVRPIALACVDEAQSIPDRILEGLLYEVLTPAIHDREGGQLAMTGTPGPVLTGLFFQATEGSLAGWERHKWTRFENVYLGKDQNDALAETLALRGCSKNDPSIAREWFGLWRDDPDALVLHFDASKNLVQALPPGPWRYVLSADIGFDDADAIAVLGFSAYDPCTYLIHEEIHRKETISRLAARISRLVDEYHPFASVLDAGGLGKKIQAELNSRHSLSIIAADKQRKPEFLALLDDALRSGRFKCLPGSTFESDCRHVEWKDKQKRKTSDDFHSDIVDSVLYGFRESLAWAEKPAPPVLARCEREEAEIQWRKPKISWNSLDEGIEYAEIEPTGLYLAGSP